jgi:hypothetical protein
MIHILSDIVVFQSYGLVGLIIGILDIIAIVSVLLGRGSIGHKLLWILLVIILPVLGLILYFLLGRSAKDL